MARRRSTRRTSVDQVSEAQVQHLQNVGTTNEQEKRVMSSVFETISAEDFAASGAGQSAEKGEWLRVLGEFAETGERHGIIRLVDAEGNALPGSRFGGRKASTIATALKQAANSKDAPDNVGQVRVMSKKGNVYLLNEAVEA